MRDFLRAVESQNARRMASYWTGSMNDCPLGQLAKWFLLIDTIRIRNLTTTVVAESEHEATVKAEYDLEMTVWGETISAHYSESYRLAEVGGRWLIADC